MVWRTPISGPLAGLARREDYQEFTRTYEAPPRPVVVYAVADPEKYLLVRPYPSLRIIFTSGSLRIPGLSQSRLMDRIGGPAHVKAGLVDALAQGVSVTAKISWLTRSLDDVISYQSHSSPTKPPKSPKLRFKEGKPRWIHCTPLLGSDSRPGVIMIVMVDPDEIAGSLNRDRFGMPQSLGMMKSASADSLPSPNTQSQHTRKESGSAVGGGSSGGECDWASKPRLYAEYLRREAKDSDARTRKYSAPDLRGQARSLGNTSVNGLLNGNGSDLANETVHSNLNSAEGQRCKSRASVKATVSVQRVRKISV